MTSALQPSSSSSRSSSSMSASSSASAYTIIPVTDLKVDLSDGCDDVLKLLGQQLDNGNCNTIVRVDIGYFHTHENNHLNNNHHRRHHHPNNHHHQHPQHGRRRLSDAELLLVFQGVVCCLPNMKTLVIMSYFRADAISLPVGALEMIFRRAARLEILFLHQIKLHGSDSEFRIMAKSLGRHSSLKRVNLHCCGATSTASTTDATTSALTAAAAAQAPAPVAAAPDDAMDEREEGATTTATTGRRRRTNLDPLVCALAALPTMYYLSLDQVLISQISIEALARSRSLRDVSFYNMAEIRPSLHILLQALSHGDNDDDHHSNGNRHDHIGSSRKSDHSGSSRRGVATTTTTASSSPSSSCCCSSCCHLRGLRIRSCNLGPEEATLIAEMLTRNTTLESLVFYVDADVWDHYGPSLAKALGQNTALKRLEVGVGKSRYNNNNSAAEEEEEDNDHSDLADDLADGDDDDDDAQQNHGNHDDDREERRRGEMMRDTTTTTTTTTTQQNNHHKAAATEIAQALAANPMTSLRHLCLCLFRATCHDIYNAYMKPFGTMLETNYSLESLLFQGSNCFSVVLCPRVGFLLKLNQRSVLDRRQLFRNVAQQEDDHTVIGTTTTDDNNNDNNDQANHHHHHPASNPWVEALTHHKDDLSIVYYLLSRNPNLMASAIAPAATATTAIEGDGKS